MLGGTMVIGECPSVVKQDFCIVCCPWKLAEDKHLRAFTSTPLSKGSLTKRHGSRLYIELQDNGF